MNVKLPCRTRAFAFALALGIASAAAAATAAPCAPSPTALCLSGNRFQVEVNWKDFQGGTGAGQAVPITADTGYFWFFSDSNIELIVKVLDARGLNGKFWVFFGALSNVEYDLKVTDSVTGSTKSYHNPSGQFASVGDTTAFDGAAGALRASHTAVAVEGTVAAPSSMADVQKFIDSAAASSTFTPCASFGSALRLAGCRFAIKVSWRDSEGREGRGTAIQLTNDTGYFWFFSPTNVELMIKVLDARPVNGNFWVFYGALSNVQYTLTVTDTLSGVVKTYSNPPGAFASLGDTAAFHPGRAIAAVQDTSRTVLAEIDSAGGSLSATAANGTQFILDIPPNALGAQTAIRMTPLSRADGLPLSRGLVGAVQLEPEGLRLFVPATLTIRPTATVRPGTVAFSYAGAGEEFALDLSEEIDGAIHLPLLHFSGYGSGQAAAADVANQQNYAPLDPIAQIRQRAMAIIERGRIFEDENQVDIPPELSPEEVHALLTELIVDAFDRYVLPALADVLPDCDQEKMRSVSELTLATLRTIQSLGLDQDLRVVFLQQTALDSLIHILEECIEKVHRDCVYFKDPFQAWTMVLIHRQLELFGVPVVSILEKGGPIEKCLRFEFQFDSTLTQNHPLVSERRRVQARAPLRIDADQSTRDVSWSGSGTSSLTEVAVVWDLCPTTSVTTSDDRLTVGDVIPALLIPLAFNADRFASDPALSRSFAIRIGYNPGYPLDSEELSCSGFPTENNQGSAWGDLYELFHHDAHPSVFLAEKWDLFNIGGLYARKTYKHSESTGVLFLSEDTTIDINHTPDEEP